MWGGVSWPYKVAFILKNFYCASKCAQYKLSKHELNIYIYIYIFIYVKVQVMVNFNLEQATKAKKGIAIWLYSFFNLGTRRGEW